MILQTVLGQIRQESNIAEHSMRSFVILSSLAKRKEEILKQHPQDIEELIIEYLTEYLVKQRHLKYSSITLQKAAILHFFIINRINLNKDWISKLVGADTDSTHDGEQEDRAYTDEEIQKLLAAADERFKVVFLLLAATGMRIGAIAELMVGHL